MKTVPVSPEECAQGRLSADALENALAAIRADGFVVLKDAVDPDHLSLIRERMLADIPLILERKDAPFNWVTGNLQQTAPPFPPYLFRDILVNDLAIQVMKAAFAGRRMSCDLYTGNTAMPSEQRQPVHFDFGPLWPGEAFAHPPHGFVVNIPVVNVSPENGATELWPGSHSVPIPFGPGGEITITEQMIEEQRAIAPPIQPTTSLGSILIRDARLWHAGMPNRTDQPRPMIALAYWIEWFKAGGSVLLPRGTEEFIHHPDVSFRARFTDDPIDHIRHGEAYDYHPEEDEGVDIVGG